MAPPTRPQITATVALPTYQLQRWTGAAWSDIADADVGDLQALVDVGGGESGLDFGAAAAPRGTIKLSATSTNLAYAWERMPIRIQFGFDTSDMLTRWQGIVTGDSRSPDAMVIVWTCEGWNVLISETECYSNALYRRPPATKTTVSSIEDPTNGLYAAGLINYILWQSGGRPYEQAATYPTATFYYSLEDAIITPEWTWIAGENGWQEIDTICKATGGQVFQDVDGVIRYRNPLVGSSSGYTFNESIYSSLVATTGTTQKTATARCSYKSRQLQAEQEIYSDTTPRLVLAGSNISIILDMSRPVYSYAVSAPGGSGLPNSGFNCTTLFGDLVVYPDVIVTYTQRAAGRCTVQVSNTLSQPIVLTNLSLRGKPIAVSEEGQASYGSGNPTREIGSGSIYIQTRTHAERLCRLYVDIYSVSRQQVVLECTYDPDRFLGEVVTVTNTELGVSGSWRIVAIDVHNGDSMRVTLYATTGLLSAAELFAIGGTYAGADVRKISW